MLYIAPKICVLASTAYRYTALYISLVGSTQTPVKSTFVLDKQSLLCYNKSTTMEWKPNAKKRERRELKSVKFDYCHQYKAVWNEDVNSSTSL